MEIEGNIKGRIKHSEPMSNHTTFKIGGPADIFIEPQDRDDIRECLRLSRSKGLRIHVLGNGSNILVNDNGFRGLVLNMSSAELKYIALNGNGLTASASLSLNELLNFAAENELTGLEFLAGIPASLGGAISTNAGSRDCYDAKIWHDISNVISRLLLMDRHGKFYTLEREDLAFNYKSLPIGDDLVLEAELTLAHSDRDVILTKMREYIKRKKYTQELNSPNAGCVFKNPDHTLSAGQLIDRCGLKGTRVGDAEISNIHANFIINRGHASSKDVLSLIEMVRGEVLGKFNIELDTEIQIV